METRELVASVKERFQDIRCLQVEHYLGLMSSPLRFHILCALNTHSFSVGELVEICEGTLSNVSQQLKLLWMGGLITKARQGKTIVYSLGDQRVAQLIATLEELFAKEVTACVDED
ncbi:MAG: metalloregulator ArsR/SmtB family transcription factor [Spirochaetales bacterium]